MRKFMPSNVPMQKFSPAHGHETAYKPSPVDYTEVPPNAHHEFNNENRGQLKAEIHKWKKRVSLLRAFSRAMSTVLNFVMFAFMAFIIGTFLATRNDQALNRNIWPKDPKTWPSIMLLVSSLVTFLLSIFVLCFYCLCFKRASDSWKLIILTYGIHISVWLTVTFLYRWEKALNDLWGWSCTDIAKELQASGQTKVDFSKLCSIQEVSWVLSIIETALKVLFGIGYFILFRKSKEVRAKQRLAEGFGEGALGLLDAL